MQLVRRALERRKARACWVGLLAWRAGRVRSGSGWLAGLTGACLLKARRPRMGGNEGYCLETPWGY